MAMDDEPKAWFYNIFYTLPLLFLSGYGYVSLRIGQPLPLSGGAAAQLLITGVMAYLPCFAVFMVRYYKGQEITRTGTAMLIFVIIVIAMLIELPIQKLLTAMDYDDLLITTVKGESRHSIYYTGGAQVGKMIGFTQAQLAAVLLIIILLFQSFQQSRGQSLGTRSSRRCQIERGVSKNFEGVQLVEQLLQIPCTYPLPVQDGKPQIRVGPFPDASSRSMVFDLSMVYKQVYVKENRPSIKAYYHGESSKIHLVCRNYLGVFVSMTTIKIS